MLTEDDGRRLEAAFGKVLDDPTRLSRTQSGRIAIETKLPLRTVEYYALEAGAVPERYDRNVAAIGADGQRKLLAGSAAVVGLGGLGGHVLEALARLGLGRIVGIDGDNFDESNLNRQLLASVDNLGASKAEQALLHVGQVNPAVEFSTHAARFEQLGEGFFEGFDLVFDCLDNMPGRRLLAERCAAVGVVLIHGAIAGWCGQVAVIPPGSDLMERLYAGKQHGLEKQIGNLHVTPAVAANVMVAKGITVLLDGSPPAGDAVQFFDLREGEWVTVRL